MRLTVTILEAIIDMANRVEAGGVEDTFGYDTAENRKSYDDCMKAGAWALQEIGRRKSRNNNHSGSDTDDNRTDRREGLRHE